jgi:hypothetical protein
MRRLLAATLLLGACSDPSQPGESGSPLLLGTWSTTPQELGPTGWSQSHLFFGKSSFIFEVRNYGTLPGQARDDLSAYVRTSGTFSVDGNRLIFHPFRLVTWDGFYGAQSPEVVQEPYPYGDLFDQARFTVNTDVLHLEYLSYPADAPVTTSLDLVRCGRLRSCRGFAGSL